jgi:uncharacterized membrane protein
MEYANLWGTHWYWLCIIPFLLMIAVFVLGSLMCRHMGVWRWSPARTGRGRFDCCGPDRNPCSDWWSETPGQILDRRYASGEITKEQHEQMKRELESSSSQTGLGAD